MIAPPLLTAALQEPRALAQQESVMLSQVRGDVHSGVLRGNGRTVRCRVRVVIKVANDRPPVVFEYQILSVEGFLPEGDYICCSVGRPSAFVSKTVNG